MIDFNSNWRGKLLQKRYCLHDLIAEGRYNRVFVAIDLASNHQKCVIKELICDSYPADIKQTIESMFQQEAKILRQLTNRHTQICQFYNYFTDSGSYYLVQEWIQGITLERKLRSRQKLLESETRNILLNLLPVLECLHNLGIIHGNINPSNIILRSADNLPILIDFSWARKVDDLPISKSKKLYQPISKISTNEHIFPKQLVGQATYNNDLYNLGLTAIHLLTGKSPQVNQSSSLNKPQSDNANKIAPLEAFPDFYTGRLHSKKTRDYYSITPPEFQNTNINLNFPDKLWNQEKIAFNPNLVSAIDRAVARNPSYRFTSAQEMRFSLQSPKQKLSLIQAEIKQSNAHKSKRKLWILCLIICVEIAVVWLGKRYLIPIPDYQPPLDFADLPQSESFIPLPVDNFTESTILDTTNDALQAAIFSPGISKKKIIQALGEPVWRKPGSWSNSIAWFYEDVVSEGIDIGYIFDRHTSKLRQAEIAVPPSTNLSTLKSALNSLLEDKASTKIIERGVKAVYKRQKATHNFRVGNLEGIIQRKHQDRIYIVVWQVDFR